MSFKEQINKDKLPKHVAVIMDGNGRWAKQQGQERIFGHQHAVESVRQVTEACVELGVEYLTLYAFSTENWSRPQKEVQALMLLMLHAIENETSTLMKNNVRFEVIGNFAQLNPEIISAINNLREKTKNNTRTTMIIALSYSSRWEITNAVKQIATQVKQGSLLLEDINEKTVSSNLCTKDFPDIDLLIRTSGEERLSNFLLWQLSYSELYFTPILWPDFRKENFYEAIVNYQERERRFGKTSQQLVKQYNK
jgi:undecaprenyl diphosphate synthase